MYVALKQCSHPSALRVSERLQQLQRSEAAQVAAEALETASRSGRPAAAALAKRRQHSSVGAAGVMPEAGTGISLLDERRRSHSGAAAGPKSAAARHRLASAAGRPLSGMQQVTEAEAAEDARSRVVGLLWLPRDWRFGGLFKPVHGVTPELMESVLRGSSAQTGVEPHGAMLAAGTLADTSGERGWSERGPSSSEGSAVRGGEGVEGGDDADWLLPLWQEADSSDGGSSSGGSSSSAAAVPDDDLHVRRAYEEAFEEVLLQGSKAAGGRAVQQPQQWAPHPSSSAAPLDAARASRHAIPVAQHVVDDSLSNSAAETASLPSRDEAHASVCDSPGPRLIMRRSASPADASEPAASSAAVKRPVAAGSRLVTAGPARAAPTARLRRRAVPLPVVGVGLPVAAAAASREPLVLQ